MGYMPEIPMKEKYYVIQVRDTKSGTLLSQWNSHCQHGAYKYHELASWSTYDAAYLAHSCCGCNAVNVYNISKRQFITQYQHESGVWPAAICRGPGPNTLLLVDRIQEDFKKRIVVLKWAGDSLQMINQIKHNHIRGSPDICLDSLHGNIYLGSVSGSLLCFPLSGGENGRPLWKLGGWRMNVSMCCDPSGRVFLSELATGRLLVVDGKTGDLLHEQNGMPE